MAQRWAIWYAIEGDLRFCSHHELMRTMERLATRARLPLRYSQGFNPRPRMSLVCPRPVGVAVREDLLVAGMETPDEAPAATVALEEAGLLAAMDAQAVPGLRFLRARPLSGSLTPRPVEITYELTLYDQDAPRVRARLEELDRLDAWSVQRLISSKEHKTRWKQQELDIKPLIARIHLAEARLTWVARRQGEAWARPGELLALVGLDSRQDLARVVRTNVVYENDPLEHPEPSATERPAGTPAAGKGNEQRDSG